jgi:adhesin HecA-like repeat protein
MLAANGDHGSLSVAGASVDNTLGVIGNSGDGATTVTAFATLTNTAGRLGGNGDVSVHAQTLANNTDGTTGALLAAGGALHLDVATAVDNRSGSLYGGNGLTLDQAGATLHNTGGQILGGTDVKLNVASLNNLGGAIRANQDVAVAGAISGSGEMAAGHNLSLAIAGDYNNDPANRLRADGDMLVSAAGTLTNTGTLAAVGGLTVQAADVVNAAGAEMNGTTTTVTAANALANAGRIEGDTVYTNSPSIINTGTILGNNVTVQGTDVMNHGARPDGRCPEPERLRQRFGTESGWRHALQCRQPANRPRWQARPRYRPAGRSDKCPDEQVGHHRGRRRYRHRGHAGEQYAHEHRDRARDAHIDQPDAHDLAGRTLGRGTQPPHQHHLPRLDLECQQRTGQHAPDGSLARTDHGDGGQVDRHGVGYRQTDAVIH